MISLLTMTLKYSLSQVLLRQNHYSNNTGAGLTNGSINNSNSNSISSENINNSRQSQQRNTAIFSNPIKQAQQVGLQCYGILRTTTVVTLQLLSAFRLHLSYTEI